MTAKSFHARQIGSTSHWITGGCQVVLAYYYKSNYRDVNTTAKNGNAFLQIKSVM
jgi:hypothetical protein